MADKMADKKGNCGCGCIGQKQGSPKVKSDKKKPKKSKQYIKKLAVNKGGWGETRQPQPLFLCLKVFVQQPGSNKRVHKSIILVK